MILGALEAGGTKMVCAIGNESGEILEQVSIPTETPEITIPKLLDFFRGKQIEALGIGCFGPIDVDRDSETYGYITTTPKLAWQDYNIVGAFKKELGVRWDLIRMSTALRWESTPGALRRAYIAVSTSRSAPAWAWV